MGAIPYGGTEDDNLKAWRVWFVTDNPNDDGWVVEAEDIQSAVEKAKGLDKGPITKVEFELCLHDNDWWEQQAGWADCPFGDVWS